MWCGVVDPVNDGFSQELSLKNNSGEPLAFKVSKFGRAEKDFSEFTALSPQVQTTAQRLFSVKPVAGIVEPGGLEVVTIKLKTSQVIRNHAIIDA
jgi:hypothetical protein